MLVVFFAGSADRAYVVFGLSYTGQIWFYRVAVFVLPVVVFFVARRLCRELQRAEAVEHDREAAEAEAQPAGS